MKKTMTLKERDSLLEENAKELRQSLKDAGVTEEELDADF